MRRSTTRWLPLLATPLMALAFARTGGAAPITYSTTGDIGNPTGAPIGNFDFEPTSGTLLGPGVFSLGSFAAQPLPEGAGLTYTNMPFYINVTLTPQGSPGTGTPPAPSTLAIQGVLNGTITGTTSSDVVATVTSIQPSGTAPLPFPVNAFNVLGPQTLAPSGVNGGITSYMAQVSASPQFPPIPEPTPLAMMGILAVGTGLRLGLRRLRCRS